MLEPRFCYRISAEAGMAHDGEGNDTSCFTQMNFEGGTLLSVEEYTPIHEKLKNALSQQLSIPVEFFEGISQEEYDENHDED